MNRLTIALAFMMAVVSISAAFPHQGNGAVFEPNKAEARSNINKDIQEFIHLIPRQKIEDIVHRYIATDTEVAQDFVFLQSDEVKTQILAIEDSAEVKKLLAQLSGVGVDTTQFINMFHDILGWEHVFQFAPRQGAGLRGCLAEIKPTIPMSKIKLLAAKKYLLSSAFRKFVKVATGAAFKDNILAVTRTPLVQSLATDALNNGVDLQALLEFIQDLSPLYEVLMEERLFL